MLSRGVVEAISVMRFSQIFQGRSKAAAVMAKLVLGGETRLCCNRGRKGGVMRAFVFAFVTLILSSARCPTYRRGTEKEPTASTSDSEGHYNLADTHHYS